MAATATGAVVVANVDDDAREVVARVVEGTGLGVVRVAVAGDVVGAAGDAGAVVLDLGGANLDVLRELRGAAGPTRDLPVVVVGSGPANGRLVLAAGADGFLVRPFHARDLQTAVTAALQRSGAERAAWRAATAAAL